MSVLAFDTTSDHDALAALRHAAEVGVAPVGSVDEACDSIKLAEQLQRFAAVNAVDTMHTIDASGIYLDQGHASARVMVAHLAGISGGHAWRLDRIRRMVHAAGTRTPPTLIAAAWRSGDLGVDQAVILAKVHANPRVRDRFVDDQAWFLAQARKLSWPRFEKRIARWLELADDDGPTPGTDPSHEGRSTSISQDHFSTAWHLRSQFGSMAGSRFAEILAAYVDAEYSLDWEQARAEHGADACRNDLRRTDAQRRADALCQMAEDAAANSSPSVRVKRVHNLVWRGETAEELFQRWNGLPPQQLDIEDYGVADLDGNIVHAPAAFAALVTDSFRRVVQNAAGITIDMSAEQRLFTGLARLGVELQTTECFWHGCHKPTSQCQIDHTRPAACGGLTIQSNGRPACKRHNLLKETGYTVSRNPDGTMQIITPTGEIVR